MLVLVNLRHLKQGDLGHQVKVLQSLLTFQGYYTETTGVFDNDTRLNLMKVQRVESLDPAVMGQCDAISWAFLLKGESSAVDLQV